jgi:hypothetical protein
MLPIGTETSPRAPQRGTSPNGTFLLPLLWAGMPASKMPGITLACTHSVRVALVNGITIDFMSGKVEKSPGPITFEFDSIYDCSYTPSRTHCIHEPPHPTLPSLLGRAASRMRLDPSTSTSRTFLGILLNCDLETLLR